jgi:hypothetical protein
MGQSRLARRRGKMIHPRRPPPGRPASLPLHQWQIPFVGMSLEFVGTQHGIGVSFFLVIAQPRRGPLSRLRHFSCPVEKRRPRHPGPEVSQITVRETGSSCPESANSPSTVAPDYWRKPRFREHRRRLRRLTLVLYRRCAFVLNSRRRPLRGRPQSCTEIPLSAPQSGTQRKTRSIPREIA